MNDPDTVASSPAASPATPVTLALRFNGRATDYFRLWAVNLCLTLLTAGIFSAWAKVRKKRFLYSHTTLDGSPFQYLGQPWPILRGRLIAALCFVAYYLSDNVFTAYLPHALGLGLALAPWVLVRSAAFNARYSAYRNMTFAFDGGYVRAVMVLYWLGVIPLITVGTIVNWWDNLSIAVGLYSIAALLYPWWICRFKGFLVTRTLFGGVRGEFDARGRQFFLIYVLSGLVLMLAAIATVAAFGTIAGSQDSWANAFLYATVPMYVGYVFAFAYVRARSANLIWNHTRLGPLQFRSTLSGVGLARLYIGNALAIVLSVGLLIPWAVLRTIRYRIDHLEVRQQGPLDTFVGNPAATVSAAGAELGEFFDLDISL